MLFNRLSAISALGLIASAFVLVQRGAKRQLERANHVLALETRYVQLLQQAAVSSNEAFGLDDAMKASVKAISSTMGWTAGHVYTLGEDGRLPPASCISSTVAVTRSWTYVLWRRSA